MFHQQVAPLFTVINGGGSNTVKSKDDRWLL